MVILFIFPALQSTFTTIPELCDFGKDVLASKDYSPKGSKTPVYLYNCFSYIWKQNDSYTSNGVIFLVCIGFTT